MSLEFLCTHTYTHLAGTINAHTLEMSGESRAELLTWVNDLLQTSYAKIELMGTGAGHCQILDSIYGTNCGWLCVCRVHNSSVQVMSP